MANANSIAGRFDGTIAYTDETWAGFHAQMEIFDISDDDLVWTLNQALSNAQMSQIYVDDNYKNAVTALFSNLPFVTSFAWSNNPPTSAKTIRDMVLHLYLIITFDDGTSYPVTITYQNGTRYDHLVDTDKLTPSDNKAQTITKIKLMLEKIIDSVTIS